MSSDGKHINKAKRRPHNSYDDAVDILRGFSKEGFSETDKHKNICIVPVNSKNSVIIDLVTAAAEMTNLHRNIEYDKAEHCLKIEFSESLAKPPVSTMRCKLERVRDYLLNDCILDPKSLSRPLDLTRNPTEYVIGNPRECRVYDGRQPYTDPDECPLNPIGLMMQFIKRTDKWKPYYRLPTDSFTASNGNTYTDENLADRTVLKEFIAKEAPTSKISDYTPIAAVIPATVMKRIQDGLGLGNEKGTYLN